MQINQIDKFLINDLIREFIFFLSFYNSHTLSVNKTNNIYFRKINCINIHFISLLYQLQGKSYQFIYLGKKFESHTKNPASFIHHRILVKEFRIMNSLIFQNK